MYISKDKLTIRSAKISDAGTLTEWWNDGKVMAHAGFPNGLGTTKNDVISKIKQNALGLNQRCIIEYDCIMIGECSYRTKCNTAEIGIKICDFSYQDRGIGTKTLLLLIDFLFNNNKLNEQINVSKIVLDTNLNNVRAQHVYEKIGFKKTAVNIDSWQDQLGRWQSSVDYELTKCEFNKLH